MNDLSTILDSFLIQAKSGDLKTSAYPKEFGDLRLRVSFGMGAPARIPWLAFVTSEMQVSKGFYPVYLYYKELETLVLAYGLSEIEEFAKTWPPEMINDCETIESFFDKKVPRYGDSFVFKAYNIQISGKKVSYTNLKTNKWSTSIDLESDLNQILNNYKKTFSDPTSGSITNSGTDLRQGLFYMEKQLEDFIISNWDKTELGKKHDLIIEDGELLSQQYKTEIGPIDILAVDKKNKNYVVIELKKNQTSDDT